MNKFNGVKKNFHLHLKECEFRYGKSNKEIYNELIQDFTNYGNTTEDYLSAEAIRAALKGLNITDLGDLKDVAPDDMQQDVAVMMIRMIMCTLG